MCVRARARVCVCLCGRKGALEKLKPSSTGLTEVQTDKTYFLQRSCNLKQQLFKMLLGCIGFHTGLIQAQIQNFTGEFQRLPF